MKRIRLSTLLLLVVIAGLAVALAVERRRSARLESVAAENLRRAIHWERQAGSDSAPQPYVSEKR